MNIPIYRAKGVDRNFYFEGDKVVGTCRDCNNDELQMLHAPVSFNGTVRLYIETVMGVVIETEDEIKISCDGHRPLVVKRGEALRWSDCRQDIEVVEIKKNDSQN